MKKVNFYEIANIIKQLNFDGDATDLRLHCNESFYWGAKTKKEYKKSTKEIDNISYKGNGWQLYAWYDVSSFEYWMLNMQEQNYIQITIAFDNDEVNEDEIPLIYKALDSALADADAIAYKYDYVPENQI